MSNRKSTNFLFVLMLALSMVIAACGGVQEAEAPVEEAAPLAEVEEAAPAEEMAAEEAAVEEAPAAEFDLVASVDETYSAIPEGFMVVKDIEKFNEARANGAYVVDVRTPGEYKEGHIPGAVNIPLRSLTQHLDRIPTDQPVFIHCKSGHRAAMALAALDMLGYDNVRSYPPGWNGWTAAEMEVSTKPVAATTFETPDIAPELLAAVDGFLSTIPDGFLAVGDLEKFNAARDNGAFVVDVRTAAEYEEGHIPEAINIPLRSLADNVDQIPSDQPVFVYCKSGHRAAIATAGLHTLDFTNVRSYPPGWNGWVKADQPVAMQ